METRILTVTLDTAKEWYNNSDSITLKKVALSLFTEAELRIKPFEKYKTWKDVENEFPIYSKISEYLTKGENANYKLYLIRNVLNKERSLSFSNYKYWFPQIRVADYANTYYTKDVEDGYATKLGTIEIGVRHYNVFSVGSGLGELCGLSSMDSNAQRLIDRGTCPANLGFLGCANREIADHMSRYFGREIFDAMYSGYVDYKWTN